MSDEQNKDTPPPAPKAAPKPPSDGNDQPAAPAEKPQFKVTRSPFTPKVGAPGNGPVKLPTPPKPVGEAPKPASPEAPAAAPKPPSPVAVGIPKPTAPTPRPKPAKPVPKARPGKPAEPLESTESASVSALGLSIDAVCAVVAVVFAALIFVGMKG
ncbi:MAG: hypothetical protein ACQKBW_11585 [Puniceicoccales bacterium]